MFVQNLMKQSMENQQTHVNFPHNEQTINPTLLFLLRQKIEQKCGRAMRTPKDFEFLSSEVYEKTHELVHVSTLKRFFRYIKDNSTPRETTLNVLCEFLGYKHWQAFVNEEGATNLYESAPIPSSHLYTSELKTNERLRLTWFPDRVMEVQLVEQNLFRIVRAEHTKLQVGHTFRCQVFIQHEPLYLTEVVGYFPHPTNFVCGKIDGITFERITD